MTGGVGGKPKTGGSPVCEQRVDASEELVLKQVQLRRPGRGATGDRDHPVALADRGPGGRDL